MTVTELRTTGEDAQATSPSPKAPVETVRDAASVASASVRVATRPRPGTGYAKHRYLVGDDVGIISDVRLPELEFFRVGKLEHGCQIEIRRGLVGRRTPRSRALLTQFHHPAAVRYEEHLGALGANFSIDLGDPIRITVSPLLARSPHVLYTNVIEALLRFVFVSRGRMLLHSACLDMNGTGVMLSAKTDTGKTGTVLRLLREKGGTFLSDDMTIVDTNGTAWCYPKPLTISAHTLRAVDPGDLHLLEWGVLNVKGRIHSKGGRAVGLGMGTRNLPIMSANSFVQMVVPPPKYPVDRLVPCEMTESVRVDDLFIIERGRPSLADVSGDEALDELLENTDDAYGFPPFRYFAPTLVIGGAEYEELRRAEAEILAGALQQIRVRRLASDTFGWADEIPRLINRPMAHRGHGETALRS
jgi:dolichol-phosphate mannosyltransferase